MGSTTFPFDCATKQLVRCRWALMATLSLRDALDQLEAAGFEISVGEGDDRVSVSIQELRETEYRGELDRQVQVESPSDEERRVSFADDIRSPAPSARFVRRVH